MKPATEIAVFGGGCFWCTEAVFKELRGVVSVVSGYAGGPSTKRTRAELGAGQASSGNTVNYDAVSSGKTGHAEVVRIEYDPAQILYEDLLTVLFATHDPTTINRQGADVGTQYRSIILYTSEAQKKAAEKFIAELNASSMGGKPIVTEVKPLEHFYEAETYHRDYYAKNQDQQYCKVVIDPKLKKVREKFAELLKNSTM